MGKWQRGQRNFISEANLYFVSFSPCLELSPRPKYSHSMKDKLQFFLLQNLRNVLLAAKLQVSTNSARSLSLYEDLGTNSV